jgi:hypothetical protein
VRAATPLRFADVTSTNLPLIWSTVATNVEATRGPWLLTFFETNNLFCDDTMASFSIDETIPPANRDANGAGTKSAAFNGWQVTLSYQTR